MRVRRVHFQNQRHRSSEGVCGGLNLAQRRGVGIQPGIDGELGKIVRVVSRRVRGKTARWSMLPSLIDGQNNHLAGAGQFAGHQDAGEVGFGAWVVAFHTRTEFCGRAA